MKNLICLLESILFVANKPLSVKNLAKAVDHDEKEVTEALSELVTARKNTGIVILDAGGEYQMTTNPLNSTHVKNFLNTDLREKLTDATVETLAIITYRQPISKAEIEAIRGVNSQYAIRHLLMRGLVEKISNPKDNRSSLYQITTEFLQHMGITSTQELPDFETLVKDIRLPEIVQTLDKATVENSPLGTDAFTKANLET